MGTVDYTQNSPLGLAPVTSGSSESSLILSDSTMYTSTTYRTSNPSSGLVSEDRPAIDARIGTRRHDASADFPVGLIPQLIDVLRVLTEGQGLLARKVRAARCDEADYSIEIAKHWDSFQIPAIEPVVGTRSTPVEQTHIAPAGDIEFVDVSALRSDTAGTLSPNVEGVGGADTSPVSVTHAPSSSDSLPANHDANSDPATASIAQSMLQSSVATSQTTTSPSRGDYNFFDELDASLASLENPPR